VSKAIDKARKDQSDWLTVGKWLKSRRTLSGHTRQSMAPLLSGHKNVESAAANVSNWENGLSFPTWERWCELKRLLQFDDSMDNEVWRLNGRKGNPGEAWGEREVVGSKKVNGVEGTAAGFANGIASVRGLDTTQQRQVDITAPATPAAQQWQGWGTALKPAFEPIVVARKPLIGTVAENVLTHGTGALNIDGCRIAAAVGDVASVKGTKRSGGILGTSSPRDDYSEPHTAGRWPANVILDESQAAALDAQSGVGVSRASAGRNGFDTGGTTWNLQRADDEVRGHTDTGGASRFFYTAKANSSERPNVDGVAHPTVKPLDLMRYLVRLVTPPGGTVLEPFAGSGTTAEACIIEGFKCIAIEMTDEYLPLILDRITKPIETVMF
jgi:hypothetical protein